ncbi:MAG: YIP1 family protein [Methanomicrobiaceae archaeon]|nr:YIP1 family protein [Methanomicrobiaceae archaeon]
MPSFGEKVKGFLVKPVETFNAHKGESLGVAYQYYIVLLLIFSILYGIVAIALDMNFLTTTIQTLSQVPGMEWVSAFSFLGAFVVAFDVFVLYVMFVIGLFWIFISGLMIHCFALMLDAEKGYNQTIKAMMYSYTPYLLLGWIPYVNIIAAIWMLVLLVLGIRELQEISSGKAVMVVMIPIVLTLVGVILFGVVIAAFIGGIIGMMSLV